MASRPERAVRPLLLPIWTRCACGLRHDPAGQLVARQGHNFSVAELRDAGVRRISLATSLYRASMEGLRVAPEEVRQQGSFGFLDRLP